MFPHATPEPPFITDDIATFVESDEEVEYDAIILYWLVVRSNGGLNKTLPDGAETQIAI